MYIACAIVSYSLNRFLMSVKSWNYSAHGLNALYMRFIAHSLQCYALYSVLVVCAEMLGFQTHGLGLTLLTSGSVIVGFSTQDVLKNFAAGIVIIFTKPFEVRDKITVDGKTGIVIDVGFFTTKLKTPSNTGICVPNSKVAAATLTNHSDNYGVLKTGMHRITVPIFMRTTTDLALAVETLKKVGLEMDQWLRQKNEDVKSKQGPALHVAHLHRYGIKLELDQDKHPTKVNIIGHHMTAGFEIELQCFCNFQLHRPVFNEAFQRTVKALQLAGIELFDSSTRERRLIEKEGSSAGKTKRPVEIENCGEVGSGGGRARSRSPRR